MRLQAEVKGGFGDRQLERFLNSSILTVKHRRRKVAQT